MMSPGRIFENRLQHYWNYPSRGAIARKTRRRRSADGPIGGYRLAIKSKGLKPLATAWGDRKPLAASFQGLVPKPGGAFAFEMRTSGVPTMLARIGVMRALNRDAERVFDPSRKQRR
jgi:hypothetical protein